MKLIVVRFFFGIFFAIFGWGRCPPDPPDFGWGTPPAINGRPQHLIEAAKRGRLDQMLSTIV